MPDSSFTYRPSAEVRRHWAVYAGLIVALGIWCGVDVARRARVDPKQPALHMTDFTVYTEAGKAFFDGREPYEVSNIRGWKYLYPPLFALLVAPLAPLAPHMQASVWFVVSALMAVGCYFECRRLSVALDARSPVRRIEEAPSSESAVRSSETSIFLAALGAVLFPALNCLQRGQMGIALVYPLLLGFRLIWLGQTGTSQILGGIALSLPIALKLTPALPAGCVIALLIVSAVRHRLAGKKSISLPTLYPPFRIRVAWPTAGLVAGSLLFFLLIPAALLGWKANWRHLETWYVKVASRVSDVRDDDFGGDVASPRNQSLFNAVYRGGNWVAYKFFEGPDDRQVDVRLGTMPMDAPVVARILTGARIAALLALGGVVFVAGWRDDGLLHGVAFGLAGVATLIVSPVSRGHYFVFLGPAVIFVALWLSRMGRQRSAMIAAVIPAVLTIAHYALLPYVGRIGLLGLGTTAWYFATCVSLCVLRENPSRVSRLEVGRGANDTTLASAA